MPALSLLAMAMIRRLNLNRKCLTKEPQGLKKSETESYTGVALKQLALLLQGGSWTVSPALAAGGGEDKVTDAILWFWIIHFHQGLSRTHSPTDDTKVLEAPLLCLIS